MNSNHKNSQKKLKSWPDFILAKIKQLTRRLEDIDSDENSSY